MCLLVKPGCSIEIASIPIIVYKIALIGEDKDRKGNIIDKWWRTFIRNFKNSPNIEIQAIDHLIIDNRYNIPTIDSGFHSLADKPSFKYPVLYAVIPKSSEYCYGINGDIVSNKIIVFENKEELNKYLKTH